MLSATAMAAQLLDPHALDSFAAGTHLRAHRLCGAHCANEGTLFVVWAPHAEQVAVVGDFNAWSTERAPLARAHPWGVWAAFVPGVAAGALYKFAIVGADGAERWHADPYARRAELRPRTASVVCAPSRYRWQDRAWLACRERQRPLARPLAIYELHAGSWRRHADGRFYSYRDLAHELPPYVAELGFTHVELMPLMEHPFDGSWGYQTTGYFAPSARYGDADDLRYLVDRCHAHGLGVLLDWSPAHFPQDAHALARFDGTHLYEPDPARRSLHPDWHTHEFDYARPEVRAFLISSAAYWIEEFHADGLRVDGVASMLYLDYSRPPGTWQANVRGGHENLAAIDFLQALNSELHGSFPGIIVIAEESTAWPGVTRPVDAGGLGFTFKWNLGWMHDTLRHLARDPVHRRYHHDEFMFPLWYAWHEHFVLSLSQDEVVHGKGALVTKAHGDGEQARAQTRLLLTHQYMSPGKKLLFMGAELAATREWDHDGELDWNLYGDPAHAGMLQLVRDLQRLYRTRPALYRDDLAAAGFRWLRGTAATESIVAYARLCDGECIIVALNLTPVPRHAYRIDVPRAGRYRTLLNTAAACYGGYGCETTPLASDTVECGSPDASALVVNLPAMAAVVWQFEQQS